MHVPGGRVRGAARFEQHRFGHPVTADQLTRRARYQKPNSMSESASGAGVRLAWGTEQRTTDWLSALGFWHQALGFRLQASGFRLRNLAHSLVGFTSLTWGDCW